MIDAVFALVLILSVVFGAKRGLFRSFMALAAIVLAPSLPRSSARRC